MHIIAPDLFFYWNHEPVNQSNILNFSTQLFPIIQLALYLWHIEPEFSALNLFVRIRLFDINL
jgi:hypothetical protein